MDLPPLTGDTRERLKHAFFKRDPERKGWIRSRYVAEVLAEFGVTVNKEVIIDFYRKFDADHDNRLTWREFISAFSAGPTPEPAAHRPGASDDGKFVDADFPPNRDSVFRTSDPAGDHLADLMKHTHGGHVKWVRATELCPGGKLFNRVSPNDIAQGVLGDCWVLAGLAALAEFEGAVYNLFQEKMVSPNGMYNFRLYNCKARRWESVVIDDFIPVDARTRKPIMAKPQGNEMWVILVEKAIAKWFGSYIQINGAYALAPFMFLTDAGPSRAFKQVSSDRSCRTYDLCEASMRDPHDRKSVHLEPKGRVSADEVWAELVEAEKKNYLMVAWTNKDPPTQVGVGACGEAIASDGIVKGHAYSLITAFEPVVNGHSYRLLRLRNPWGANPKAEWKGVLSDSWSGWKDNPELAKLLRIDRAKLDGMFWMTWHDFRCRFSSCGINPQSMRVPRLGSIDLQRPEGNGHGHAPAHPPQAAGRQKEKKEKREKKERQPQQSASDSEELPEGWEKVPSQSRPGEFSYLNKASGEKVATLEMVLQRQAAVVTEKLPEGWEKVASQSRPGEFSYSNKTTGERVATLEVVLQLQAAKKKKERKEKRNNDQVVATEAFFTLPDGEPSTYGDLASICERGLGSSVGGYPGSPSADDSEVGGDKGVPIFDWADDRIGGIGNDQGMESDTDSDNSSSSADDAAEKKAPE